MKTKFTQRLFLVLLLTVAHGVQAAITCTISTPGFSAAYVPSTAAMNITQTSFTMRCQRNLAGDPTTITYGVRNDNGLNETGFQNRARFAGVNYINYDVFANSGCSIVWRNNAANDIVDTITGLTGFLPISKITNYWGCIPGSQIGKPAGTYVDTLTLSARQGTGGGPVIASGSGLISIVTPATCTISSPPGNVAFGTYTAFGPIVNANTTFAANCTSLLPYSMALDATGGVVAGLNYSLALNTSGTGGINPLTSTGTGVAQSFFINGSMPAGQAGTCATGSCPGTQAHTLTITY